MLSHVSFLKKTSLEIVFLVQTPFSSYTNLCFLDTRKEMVWFSDGQQVKMLSNVFQQFFEKPSIIIVIQTQGSSLEFDAFVLLKWVIRQC